MVALVRHVVLPRTLHRLCDIWSRQFLVPGLFRRRPTWPGDHCPAGCRLVHHDDAQQRSTDQGGSANGRAGTTLPGSLTGERSWTLAGAELKRLRADGSSVAVVLADLDHFKAVNDEHGHRAGDAALKAFAEACRESVRSTDLVGRYGGEEFVLFLPGATQKRAEDIALEISKRMATMEVPGGGRFPHGQLRSHIQHSSYRRPHLHDRSCGRSPLQRQSAGQEPNCRS
ncbi:GGDEF domain-containing protein [Paenarthrobacter ureafaciens]